jgi:hypothetical protein
VYYTCTTPSTGRGKSPTRLRLLKYTRQRRQLCKFHSRVNDHGNVHGSVCSTGWDVHFCGAANLVELTYISSDRCECWSSRQRGRCFGNKDEAEEVSGQKGKVNDICRIYLSAGRLAQPPAVGLGPYLLLILCLPAGLIFLSLWPSAFG